MFSFFENLKFVLYSKISPMQSSEEDGTDAEISKYSQLLEEARSLPRLVVMTLSSSSLVRCATRTLGRSSELIYSSQFRTLSKEL